MSSGSLFPNKSKSEFLRLSLSRFNAMVVRNNKKKLPPLAFNKDMFRAYISQALDGRYDGVLKCRYCNQYFNLEDTAVDHAVPLSRGGSSDLDNLEFPCKKCNSRKGSLTPTEYLKLVDFLEREIPLGRQDVLKRLETSVQLAAGSRANAGIIGDLRKSGVWGAAQKSRKARK